ncbi:hypothetical protein PIB30_072370 [Stylosanthes scabra]|uniref:Uncharacterized protein n=1 Tax=Stylosanthes scabra TaxID=79078 RepID=A0ABU6ZMP3_9FABA|nr:hypothetical protein [Stylosanthes scabra]
MGDFIEEKLVEEHPILWCELNKTVVVSTLEAKPEKLIEDKALQDNVLIETSPMSTHPKDIALVSCEGLRYVPPPLRQATKRGRNFLWMRDKKEKKDKGKLDEPGKKKSVKASGVKTNLSHMEWNHSTNLSELKGQPLKFHDDHSHNKGVDAYLTSIATIAAPLSISLQPPPNSPSSISPNSSSSTTIHNRAILHHHLRSPKSSKPESSPTSHRNHQPPSSPSHTSAEPPARRRLLLPLSLTTTFGQATPPSSPNPHHYLSLSSLRTTITSLHHHHRRTTEPATTFVFFTENNSKPPPPLSSTITATFFFVNLHRRKHLTVQALELPPPPFPIFINLRTPSNNSAVLLSLCDRSFQPPSGESSVATTTPIQASVNFALFPCPGAVAFQPPSTKPSSALSTLSSTSSPTSIITGEILLHPFVNSLCFRMTRIGKTSTKGSASTAVGSTAGNLSQLLLRSCFRRVSKKNSS